MNTPQKTQTKFSAKQAGKEVGKAPSTILRAIKSGKLSAKKDADGNWEIDAAELFRVYAQTPVRTSEIDNGAHRIDTPNAHHEHPNEIKLLEQKVEFLNEKLDDRNNKIEEVIEERNSWKKQAETLLLQNQPANQTEQKPPETKNILPWLIPPIFIIAFAAAIMAAQSFLH